MGRIQYIYGLVSIVTVHFCYSIWKLAWTHGRVTSIAQPPLVKLRGWPVTLQIENSFKCGTIMRFTVLIL